MNISVDGSGGKAAAATVSLNKDEMACVLHPDRIIAFQGNAGGREDRFLNLAGMYRKKRWIESRLRGPAKFVLGVPAGYNFKALELPASSNLLFDIKHVMLYDGNLRLENRFQRVKQALITRDWVRMKFSGGGMLGLVSGGPLTEMDLHPSEPVYVDIGCLVAYPEDVSMRLAVYGNPLASQRMPYQWEMTGQGKLLLQPGPQEIGRHDPLKGDSLTRRLLREMLPFGGVLIK